MSDWIYVRLGELLTESKIVDDNPDPDRKIRVKLNCKGVEKRPLKAEKEGATKNYIRRAGQFIYGKQNFHKGAFGVIPANLDGFSSSADLPAFDVDSRCFPQWIDYWFKTDNRYLRLAKHAKGVGSQRVNLNSFLKEKIALPSLNLQSKIINKINKSNIALENLDTENENQTTYLTKLRQAILQEAIEGKLTESWRRENPLRKGDPDYDADALLEKIKAEKEKLVKEGKIKKQKPLVSIKAEEVPFELPEGWVWTRLGEIGSVVRGKSPIYSEEGELIVLNQKCVRWFHIDNVWGKFVSEKWLKSVDEKLFTRVGDILVNSTGEGTIGRAAIVDEKSSNLLFDSHVLKYSTLADSLYVLNCLNSKYSQSQIEESKGAKTTKQTELGVGNLSNLTIPFPPLAEQKAIVGRLEKLLSVIDELEKQVFERKEQAEQLMQAVLREAFEGGK